MTRDYGRDIPFFSVEPAPTIADWLAARSIAREYTPIERGDHVRAYADADRVRRALALPSYRNHVVVLACFNYEEARAVRLNLDLMGVPLERVRLTYNGGVL